MGLEMASLVLFTDCLRPLLWLHPCVRSQATMCPVLAVHPRNTSSKAPLLCFIEDWVKSSASACMTSIFMRLKIEISTTVELAKHSNAVLIVVTYYAPGILQA
jgi:hypothetical protein